MKTDSISLQRTQTQVRVNEYVRGVYNWMAAGLAVTGGVAFFTAQSESLLRLLFGTGLVWGLFIAEIVIVVMLAGRIHKMAASTATMLFMVYAGLNGLVLSSIFLMYTMASIASTFFICSATFLTLSIYGWATKRDLTSWGSFLYMGLFGIIIASVVNFFMHSPLVYAAVTYIGVFIFVGLTAYDTQKIKYMALSQPAGLDAAVIRKGAIQGALTLYLDFINLFILLLRIFGGSRD